MPVGLERSGLAQSRLEDGPSLDQLVKEYLSCSDFLTTVEFQFDISFLNSPLNLNLVIPDSNRVQRVSLDPTRRPEPIIETNKKNLLSRRERFNNGGVIVQIKDRERFRQLGICPNAGGMVSQTGRLSNGAPVMVLSESSLNGGRRICSEIVIGSQFPLVRSDPLCRFRPVKTEEGVEIKVFNPEWSFRQSSWRALSVKERQGWQLALSKEGNEITLASTVYYPEMGGFYLKLPLKGIAGPSESPPFSP